ncbi:hypothetical protein V8C37DRAFT_24550 [Trichoderma ceciliae]
MPTASVSVLWYFLSIGTLQGTCQYYYALNGPGHFLLVKNKFKPRPATLSCHKRKLGYCGSQHLGAVWVLGQYQVCVPKRYLIVCCCCL